MAYGNRFKSGELGIQGTGTSEVYAQAAYDLGSVYVQPASELASITIEGTVIGNSGIAANTNFALLSGDRTWVFIQAAGAIGAGDVVIPNAAIVPFGGRQCNAAATYSGNLIGVADHAIPLGSFGWVICEGACVVRGIAANAGVQLQTNNAGQMGLAASLTDNRTVAKSMEALSATLANFTQVRLFRAG
jgi:hypothetical protein